MKKFIVLFLIALISISPVYSNELADDYFDIARNFAQNGDNTRALEYVNYVLMINPHNAKAMEFKNKLIPQETNDDLVRTALTLAKQNNVSELSILDIPKSNKYKIENTSEYYNKQGKQYYLNEDYDNAIQSFFRAVTLDNKNYIAYNNLGLTYWMRNNLDNAEKYFKKATQICKTYPQPFINLALLYKQRGNMDKHIEYLNKALEANPDNYWTYYLIGDYYSSVGNYPASIQYYETSISLNSNFAPPYLALGVAYFKTDKYEKSIDAIEDYLELNSNSDFAYSMLAKNYYLTQDYTLAKQCIKKALMLNQTNTYRMELAKIEFSAGEYENALLNFQILEPDYPYADLYNYIGLCNLNMNRYELAVINFNKAIVADNQRPIYYYNLSQCYKALDEKKKQVQYLNTAIQITPVTYQDYIDLSYIYYDTEKSNMAIRTLENGIAAYPDNKTLYLALMSLYKKLGETTKYNNIKNTIEMRFNTNEEQKKTYKLFR